MLAAVGLAVLFAALVIWGLASAAVIARRAPCPECAAPPPCVAGTCPACPAPPPCPAAECPPPGVCPSDSEAAAVVFRHAVAAGMAAPTYAALQLLVRHAGFWYFQFGSGAYGRINLGNGSVEILSQAQFIALMDEVARVELGTNAYLNHITFMRTDWAAEAGGYRLTGNFAGGYTIGVGAW